jgi:hypothetical protein
MRLASSRRAAVVIGALVVLALRPGLHLSAGRWVGGWGAETDQLGAEVCVTRSARHGWMLAGRELGCRDASSHRRLGGWFTGAYVSALDARRREMACVQGLATSATLICRGGSSVPRWGALDGPISGTSHRTGARKSTRPFPVPETDEVPQTTRENGAAKGITLPGATSRPTDELRHCR